MGSGQNNNERNFCYNKIGVSNTFTNVFIILLYIYNKSKSDKPMTFDK
jgi:hypothetical protein